MELTAKGDKAKYSNHTTQINLDDCMGEKDFNFILLQRKIPDPHVYREFPQIESGFLGFAQDHPNESYGLEKMPHITVLYGLQDEQDYFGLRENLKGFGKIDFTIGDVKSFRREDSPFDVLYVEVISQRLKDLHEYIKANYDNSYSFPEYTPHITLSYVQKGVLKELEGGNAWKGTTYSVSRIVFGHKDGFYLELPLC